MHAVLSALTQSQGPELPAQPAAELSGLQSTADGL